MSHVTCNYLFILFMDKVVELACGGSSFLIIHYLQDILCIFKPINYENTLYFGECCGSVVKGITEWCTLQEQEPEQEQ